MTIRFNFAAMRRFEKRDAICWEPKNRCCGKATMDDPIVELPPKLSCPSCGATEYGCDDEGRCLCKNDHFFWDTNSWEWKTLRRAQAAEREVEKLKERIEWLREEVDKLRWKLQIYEQITGD